MPYPVGFLESRAVVKPGSYAVIPPEGRVINSVPGFSGCRLTIICSPKIGASFVQYVGAVEAGGLGEVAAVPLEGLVLVFGVGVGDPRRSAHRLQCREDPLAGDAGLAQHLGGRGRAVDEREEQVLGGDVLVAHPLRLLPGPAQDVAVGGGQL